MEMTDLVRSIVREELENIIQENAETEEAKQLEFEDMEHVSSDNRQRFSFDLNIEMMKELKVQSVLHEKNMYEIIENAVQKELNVLKRGFID